MLRCVIWKKVLFFIYLLTSPPPPKLYGAKSDRVEASPPFCRQLENERQTASRIRVFCRHLVFLRADSGRGEVLAKRQVGQSGRQRAGHMEPLELERAGPGRAGIEDQ